MKLTIENVARVDKAEIELNGITVIAGYNRTGKSTIGKSLYSMLYSFANLESLTMGEIWSSLNSALGKWQDKAYEAVDVIAYADNSEIIEYLIDKKRKNEEILEMDLKNVINENNINISNNEKHKIDFTGFKDTYDEVNSIINNKDKYAKFSIGKVFKSTFSNQINTINSKNEANFILNSNDIMYSACFADNEIKSYKNSRGKLISPIYLETMSILDIGNSNKMRARNRGLFEPSGATFRLNQLLNREIHLASMTLEQSEKYKLNCKAIYDLTENIIKGGLQSEGHQLKFFDEELQENIEFSNIASGLKVFAIIKRLVSNGSLLNGATLIIDEPEVNLHPEWQLKLAEILVVLQKELQINILINTHSPYFLRAIQVFAAKHIIADKTKYYMFDFADNKFVYEDVTTNTGVVFERLTKPFDDLESMIDY